MTSWRPIAHHSFRLDPPSSEERHHLNAIRYRYRARKHQQYRGAERDRTVGLLTTADGGVLGVADPPLGSVFKLGPDGTPGWTFTSGGSAATPSTLVARGTSFAVAGISHGAGDFDPGTAIDIVDGDIIFLSRFTF